MKSLFQSLALSASLALGAAAQAEPLPDPVVVEFRLGAQTPEQTEEMLITPLERGLAALPRVVSVHGSVTYGSAHLELRFEDKATDDDVAAVSAYLDRYAPAFDARAAIRLDEPLLERGLLHRIAHPPAEPGPAAGAAAPA